MSDARGERELRGEGVRKRKPKNEKLKEPEDAKKQTVDSKSNLKEPENTTVSVSAGLQKGTYWLTRIVLLRYLGFIYSVAFLVALHQNKQLIGKDGLLPAHKYLNNIKNRVGGIKQDMFIHCPSIIWLFNYNANLDQILDYLAYSGLALSLFVVIRGAANWFIMLALWVIYHSIVSVGQQWFSFGWESQLLETGFLAIFLCPILNLSTVPQHTPTSVIIIYAYRWLIFRIMLGAGLIKIRGDQCWRDLTCMNYHYETQPVPNPLSYYLHQSPELIHKMETLGNHFIELVAPFFLILGRRMTIIGGGIQIFFQVVLIISGNLSFLNWLTIVPSLACFDDRSLSWMFSGHSRSVKCRIAQIQHQMETGKLTPKLSGYIRRVFNISFGLLIAYLSIPVVQNLLSKRQAMNTSFDSLRLVNTYGAFGSITKERTEVIMQGTSSSDPNDPSAKWLEYEFKCKPGNITRRPCVISPYHYRMDWLAWFAAFQNYQHNPWLVHAAMKLLINDEGTTSLIAHNPFEGQAPPKYIRLEHYRYAYTKIGSKEAKSGAWWHRKHIGNYLPPISLRAARDIARQMDWDIPRLKKK